jgi:hypothetical protein
VRGSAAQALINFQFVNTTGTLEEFVAYMSMTYGTVASPSVLLQDFFSAKQRPDEDLALWSQRIQMLYRRAGAAQEHTLQFKYRNEDLKSRFWQGLLNARLQDLLRPYKDDDQVAFETLMLQARGLSQEFKSDASTRAKSKPVASLQPPEVFAASCTATTDTVPTQATSKSKMKTVSSTGNDDTLAALVKRIEELEKRCIRPPAPSFGQHNVSTGNPRPFRPRPRGTCFYCNGDDHFIRSCPYTPRNQTPNPYYGTFPSYNQFQDRSGNWRGPRPWTNPWAQ